MLLGLLTADAEHGGLNLVLPGLFYKWFQTRSDLIDDGKNDDAKKLWTTQRNLEKRQVRPVDESFGHLVLNGNSALTDQEFAYVIDCIFNAHPEALICGVECVFCRHVHHDPEHEQVCPSFNGSTFTRHEAVQKRITSGVKKTLKPEKAMTSHAQR